MGNTRLLLFVLCTKNKICVVGLKLIVFCSFQGSLFSLMLSLSSESLCSNLVFYSCCIHLISTSLNFLVLICINRKILYFLPVENVIGDVISLVGGARSISGGKKLACPSSMVTSP